MDSQIFKLLLAEASSSPCVRHKYGAATLNFRGRLTGSGFNRPPQGFAFPCFRDCSGNLRKGISPNTCVERCYASHAEQVAIISAMRKGLSPYHICILCLDGESGEIQLMDEFPCTVCARLIVEAEIRFVWLWSSNGWMKIPADMAYRQAYDYIQRPAHDRDREIPQNEG